MSDYADDEPYWPSMEERCGYNDDPQFDKCPFCFGSGTVSDDEGEWTCQECAGDGYLET